MQDLRTPRISQTVNSAGARFSPPVCNGTKLLSSTTVVSNASFQDGSEYQRLVSVTLIVNVVASWSPESNPAGSLPFAARCVHGLAKDDCVTE